MCCYVFSVSGCTDYFSETEEEAFSTGRDVVATFNIPPVIPAESIEEPLYDPKELAGIIPVQQQHTMDMYKVGYTPSQRGHYHHSMFHNPTAAVNLFHVGKQYLTFCKAEAAVTHNLIGRKIISNVKHSDARNSHPILDVIRSSHKRHSASEYCK